MIQIILIQVILGNNSLKQILDSDENSNIDIKKPKKQIIERF